MCRTKNGTLRKSSINRVFLQKLIIQNHLKLMSIFEERWNKAKWTTWTPKTWVCEEDQYDKPYRKILVIDNETIKNYSRIIVTNINPFLSLMSFC